jgi:hypothetical protein
MIQLEYTTSFPSIDLEDFIIEPLPKIIDNRGYLYIGIDSAYPDYIKIGRTGDLSKRLTQYNSDKPFPTFTYITISRLYKDCHYVEKKILEALYGVARPTTLKYEWFEKSILDIANNFLLEAEDVFE